MKKLLFLLLIPVSVFGMYKDYTPSKTYKPYEYKKPYIPTLSCEKPESTFPSRVYFQVTATEKPFYIPVVPHKKEPTALDLKMMAKAKLFEDMFYRPGGAGQLRHRRDSLERNYQATESGMSKSTRTAYEKEIALLNSYLSKYGIEDLEQILLVPNAQMAIALYEGLASAKHIDPKLVTAAKNSLEARADYQEYLKEQEVVKAADMVTTTPTDSDLFHQHVKADPKKDFVKFVEETSKLLEIMEDKLVSGGKEVTLFLKEFSEHAAECIVDIGSDPKAYAAQFVEGNIELVKKMSQLLIEVYSQPEELHVPERDMLRYEEKMKEVSALYDHLAKSIPEMSREDWAKLCARFSVDAALIHCTGVAVNKTIQLGRSVPGALEEMPMFSKIKERLGLFAEQHPELVTAEGLTFKAAQSENELALLREVESIPKVEWADHYHKHKPPKNISWKEIIKSTKYGDAKYKPGINIKELELHAWEHGQKVTIPGKNWKVMKYDRIIGSNSGQETCYMRVECSANVVHGHPILESDYLRNLK